MKKRTYFWIMIISVLALLISACGGSQSSSQGGGQASGSPSGEGNGGGAADFYKGKTVKLIVPHGAGGGFDTYARLTAPYLEKYLGATVVVENVTGAGGNIGRNQLWRAKKDGLSIGFTSFPSMVFSQLSGAEGIEYDVAGWEFLGRVVAESEVVSVPKGGKIQSLEELMNAKGQVRIPLSGIGDDTFFKAMILGKALGIDLLPVTGYDGTSEAFAAAMRGDGEIVSSSIGSSAKLIESGDLKPILQMALVPDSSLENVPLATDVIEDETMRGFIQSITNIAALDRSFFAPPGIPEDRLQFLREAVSKTLQDPEFLKSAESAGRLIDFMSAEEEEQLAEEALADAESLKPLLMEALEKAQ